MTSENKIQWRQLLEDVLTKPGRNIRESEEESLSSRWWDEVPAKGAIDSEWEENDEIEAEVYAETLSQEEMDQMWQSVRQQVEHDAPVPLFPHSPSHFRRRSLRAYGLPALAAVLLIGIVVTQWPGFEPVRKAAPFRSAVPATHDEPTNRYASQPRPVSDLSTTQATNSSPRFTQSGLLADSGRRNPQNRALPRPSLITSVTVRQRKVDAAVGDFLVAKYETHRGFSPSAGQQGEITLAKASSAPRSDGGR